MEKRRLHGRIPSMYNKRNVKTNAFNWLWLGKTKHWTRRSQIKHSHIIVEKRRWKINYRTKESEALLPEHNVASSIHRNKVAILAATVDYIKQFRQKDDLQNLEERQHKTEEQIKIIKEILSMQQCALRDAAPASGKRSNAKYILKGYIPVYEQSNEKDKQRKH